MKVKVSNVNQPVWKEVNVHANLPENLNKLQELAYNLWWVWNHDGKELFRNIDKVESYRTAQHPELREDAGSERGQSIHEEVG